jgi:high-affinity iron transporter
VIQAFVVVFRELFEAFLIVAIIVAYLKKTNQSSLLPAVKWGVGASLLGSGLLGFILWKQANEPLWEAVLGFIAAGMVSWLVVHMWQTAPRLKKEMEAHLSRATFEKPQIKALVGVFLFTFLMISREGMETALLLIQIHDPALVSGILFGLLAAAALAWLWTRLGHLINLKLFFQVTAVFLLLLVVQILLYSLHELTETGILPNSEALHEATEPFSSDGFYSRWLTNLMLVACVLWPLGAWVRDRFFPSRIPEEATVAR